MKKNLISVFCLFFLPLILLAQKSVVLKGEINNRDSKAIYLTLASTERIAYLPAKTLIPIRNKSFVYEFEADTSQAYQLIFKMKLTSVYVLRYAFKQKEAKQSLTSNLLFKIEILIPVMICLERALHLNADILRLMRIQYVKFYTNFC